MSEYREAANCGEAGTLRVAGDCFVRAEPRAGATLMAVAKRGDRLASSGEKDGAWLGVMYEGRKGWVLGKLMARVD